ncbi:deoxycytidylate deaminase [Streptosporangium sp. OZ121]|uniref:deoxycytidylate deaminase n=1 Tax=unclassified Streptosporangium TaxID=2632669 RepID=UPI003F7A815B
MANGLSKAWTWPSDVITSIEEAISAVGHTGNCLKRKVGAALVSLGGSVLVAGANGTPEGMQPCDQGGCVRCATASRYAHGVGYDLCLCLHAEQSVLLSALHNDIKTRNCILVTSYQPCFMCAKLIVAARMEGVLYSEPWRVPEEESGLAGLTANYEALWTQLPMGCVRLNEESRPL